MINDKKGEPNFEKIYTQIIEFKSDTLKSFEATKSFLNEYLSSTFQSSSNEIDNFISIIEKNKSIAKENIENFKNYLIQIYSSRLDKLKRVQLCYEELNQKTKKIKTGKIKYKECNMMRKQEIISIKFQIASLSHKIKSIQNDTLSLENEISNLKKENKSSYTTEISLLEQVMSFDKKLYTVYNARDAKQKQKNQLENELKIKKEEYEKKKNDNSKMIINEYNKQINTLEQEKKNLTDIYNKLESEKKTFLEILDFLKEKYKIMTENSYDKSSNNSVEFNQNIFNEKEKYKAQISSLMEQAVNEFPFLHLKENDANLTSICNQLNNFLLEKKDDVKNEIEKSKEIHKKIKNEIIQKFYYKIRVHKIFEFLKKNYQVIKSRKQFEEERQNKIKKLKMKEAQLMKELELQAGKQAQSLIEAQQLAQLKTEMKKTKHNKKFKKSKNSSNNSPYSQSQNYANILNLSSTDFFP